MQGNLSTRQLNILRELASYDDANHARQEILETLDTTDMMQLVEQGYITISRSMYADITDAGMDVLGDGW